ncbi:uncharacterized protein BXZ73DRAFT_100278 [Epithele typhae]|uniref:uncharacterized protein n=1 Tax=Epithele typhae TaxID=378194 RepID=UPI002007E740|nr:uncharacterized protein BXZ73DRAFT_100278 [Epithele typhae]KAH9936863.1 hypothetical protein BXZ73DRAFT_100278 [Epithele typhae]
MPRLQASRRASLLATEQRHAFIHAFHPRLASLVVDRFLCDSADAPGLGAVARRVQSDLRGRTGRYFPIHQVLSTIHDVGTRKKGVVTTPTVATQPPALSALRIVITPTTPMPAVPLTASPPSMSRRRLQRNIPALQCQLPVPLPVFSPSLFPDHTTPTTATPTMSFASYAFAQYASTISCSSPITPVEQILPTPRSPPKMPRVAPAPPRMWSRLNAQARQMDSSPLGLPKLPYSPDMLGSSSGKPLLGRLHIPESDPDPFGFLISPSIQPHVPFNLMRAQSPVEAMLSPSIGRTGSSSALSRAAMMRFVRPSLPRSFSMTTKLAPGQATSPLSPFGSHALGSPLSMDQPLASPFAARPKPVEGSYF